jgi:hypothetical protein
MDSALFSVVSGTAEVVATAAALSGRIQNNAVIAGLKCVRENYSFAPLGLHDLPLFTTAYAVGCILTPLRG